MARQQPSVYLEKHFPIYSNGLSPKWESCQHLESQEKPFWKQQLVYLLSHLNFTLVSQKILSMYEWIPSFWFYLM